jgi:hypothetical protein
LSCAHIFTFLELTHKVCTVCIPAFFGNLLGVKPIIISDVDGQNVPILKVKGRNASLDKLVALMGESVISPETQTVYISHADCPEAAEYLKEKLLPLGFADARIGCIGAVVGAGLTKGWRCVNFGVFKNIGIAWVSSPCAAGLVAYLVALATKGFLA